MNDPDFDPYRPPRAPLGRKPPPRSGAEVPEGNPWLTIWTRPRGTIRGIVETDPTRGVVLLAALSGISNALSQMFQKNAGDSLPLAGILGASAVTGVIGGLIGLYLLGFLIRVTGSWLGGAATAEEVRAAVAWSSIPNVAAIPVLLLGAAAFGQDFFRTGGLQPEDATQGLLLIALGLAMIVLGVWAAFLNIKCIAEVHRVSAWKGLGALLLAGLLFLAVVLVVVALTLAMRAGG